MTHSTALRKLTAFSHPATHIDSPQSVLLLGADLDDAELLAEALKRKGFEVLIASSPQECLKVILQRHSQHQSISSVFLSLDVSSGLDGFSTARLLRQNAFWGSIIVYSDHYLGRYEWESEEAGCDAFILREQLEQRIEEILNGRDGSANTAQVHDQSADDQEASLATYKLATSY